MQITRDSLAAIAPRPRGTTATIWDGYANALIAAWPQIVADYGISNRLRLAHLLATWAHETGGFTILWESLHYTSVSAVRKAWRQRARKHSDSWIEAHLLRNPVALGDWAYGNRMGNRKGTTDGYDFRGFGIQQITGRTDHQRLLAGEYTYGAAIRAAMSEWSEKGCNALADADDVRGVRRQINGGLNGIADVERYLAKAKRVIDSDEWAAPQPATPVPVTISELTKSSRKVRLLERIKTALGISGLLGSGWTLSDAWGFSQGSTDVLKQLLADHMLLVVAGLCLAGLLVAVVLQHWIAEDARDGRYQPSGAR